MDRILSTGEWRLFLLSDCVKYYPEVSEHTEALRRSSKEDILSISGDDSKELDNFITVEDATKIRAMLRKEWRFTNKVVDLGRGNKTTCEYCQKQQIRYKYLCRNDKRNVWLAVGSVCVGYIIHGEAKMKDENFANSFVSDLDKLKANSTESDPTNSSYEDAKEKREVQGAKIKLYYSYLRGRGIDSNNSDFLKSLSERWSLGKALTDNQMVALENMCRKVKYGKSEGDIEFKSLDAEIQYQKIMKSIQSKPDNEFLQHCKMRIERYGELTDKQAKALMG